MAASVELELDGAIARVTLVHSAKFNAFTRTMWRQLRGVFEGIQQSASVRCVVVRGADGNFCAGGDIQEYPDFRFNPETLRDFHETDVWGGLAAVLACDVPIVAQIEGFCMGAGLEIASCCDLRLADHSARFGAPIARLGFPMAPREARLVGSAVGQTTARAMLLAAAVFKAPHMLQCGFLTELCAQAELDTCVQAQVDRMVVLAPLAARQNKRTLRELFWPADRMERARPATESIANLRPLTDMNTGQHNRHDPADHSDPYAYAGNAEHREGIAAFLAKRNPEF